MVELSKAGSSEAKIAVAIPCWNDGALMLETIGSLQGEPGVELLVVDDGSDQAETIEIVAMVERAGVRVLRQPENRGLSAARNLALQTAAAPFFFPLDSDDLAIPGALNAMRERLEGDPEAGVCFGDYVEFGNREVFRAVPTELDGYRLAYANEYPVSSMFRREVLAKAGGWDTRRDAIAAHEDWNLWLTLIEMGARGVHLGAGRLTYARRIHADRLAVAGRSHHTAFYRALVENHPGVFDDLSRYRRQSSLSPVRRAIYPYVYGGRPRRPFERTVKELLDRRGIWTLTTERRPEQRRLLEAALANGCRGPDDLRAAAARELRT